MSDNANAVRASDISDLALVTDPYDGVDVASIIGEVLLTLTTLFSWGELTPEQFRDRYEVVDDEDRGQTS